MKTAADKKREMRKAMKEELGKVILERGAACADAWLDGAEWVANYLKEMRNSD